MYFCNKCIIEYTLVSSMRVLTVLRLAALQRLRLVIQTSLLGSYMRKTTRTLRRLNIGNQDECKQQWAWSDLFHRTLYARDFLILSNS